MIEILETALHIATPVVMRTKIALGCPRPSQFSDMIQPVIHEPGYPAMSSGHATQVFLMATVLSQLMQPGTQVVSSSHLYRLACRIAFIGRWRGCIFQWTARREQCWVSSWAAI